MTKQLSADVRQGNPLSEANRLRAARDYPGSIAAIRRLWDRAWAELSNQQRADSALLAALNFGDLYRDPSRRNQVDVEDFRRVLAVAREYADASACTRIFQRLSELEQLLPRSS